MYELIMNVEYTRILWIVVNLACEDRTHLLVSSFIQYEDRGLGKEGEGGNSYFYPLRVSHYQKILKSGVIIYQLNKYISIWWKFGHSSTIAIEAFRLNDDSSRNQRYRVGLIQDNINYSFLYCNNIK